MSDSVWSRRLSLIYLNTDALFVETGGDLDVYKTAGSTGAPPSGPSTKCCAAAASPLPQTTIRSLNEWAGKERIVDRKNIKTDS